MRLSFASMKLLRDSDRAFDSLPVGVSGCLLKRLQIAANEIVTAVEQFHAVGAPMSAEVARK